MRRSLLAVPLLALPCLVPATAAEAAGLAGYCPDPTGVTVVVDFQELGGGVVVRCSTSGNGTGLAALEGAGFSVDGTARFGSAFVCRIAGKPSPADEACVNTPPASAFWSYWHASDGGPWTRSNAGAAGYVPAAGSFEGWSFSKGRSESTAPRPGVAAKRPAVTTPAPVVTTPPVPSSSARPSAGSTPRTTTAPTSPTSPAGPVPPTGSTTPALTGTPGPVASATSPAPGPATSPSASPTVPVGQDPTATADPSGAVSFDLPDGQDDAGGSPVGAIVSAVLVAVAAGGAGAYALRRRRSP